MSLSLNSAEATQALGKKLGEILPAGTVILLQGDLGAGKTTLIQGLAKGLAIDEPVVSPTFTLINEYLEGKIPLYHLDLYRLDSADVETLYPEMYWEGIEVEPGITAIEWSERLSYKPDTYLLIQLQNSDVGRNATIQLFGNESQEIGDRIQKIISSFPLIDTPLHSS
ncbi:MAG: tRNA (adenosine(37)-N6)-threonylcarbamoyltransferase complex ATPase subunit type 1 TsaE [Chroococcales cyanobacterium]